MEGWTLEVGGFMTDLLAGRTPGQVAGGVLDPDLGG